MDLRQRVLTKGIFIFLILVIIPFFHSFLQSFPDMACAAEITLAWDPNSESNLAGYKLYYESENDVELYAGQDANEGDSPIIIYVDELERPNSPSYTISGLNAGVCYYFNLVAFNEEGIESSFSGEVGVVVGKKGYNLEAGSDTSCFISGVIGVKGY